MSDTTTITPEKRKMFREDASFVVAHEKKNLERVGAAEAILLLLNALEQAEARAEKADANVSRLQKMVDWLANKLIDCPPGFTNCAVDCAECRIEAARRAVGGEG